MASNSTLTRLAWQLPLTALALVVVALYPAYRYTTSVIQAQVWQAIDEEIAALNFALNEFGIEGLVSVIRGRIASNVDPAAVYLLTDSTGRPIVGNLKAWPAAASVEPTSSFVMDIDGQRVEGRAFVIQGDRRLLVAHGSPLRQLERAIALSLVAAGITILIVTAVIASSTLIRYRRRLSAISVSVGRILEGDVHQRLPLLNDRELDQVSGEFNSALDAMERALDAVKHVTSAVAHDMRRPIAAIRYQLAELIEDPSINDETKERLVSTLEMTDSTLTSFAALLRLARLESESYAIANERVDLEALLEDVRDTYQPVLAEIGKRLELKAEPISILGDRSLLFQVLQNLLDNAINYAASDVEVRLYRVGAQAVLEVRDYGPGVPNEALPRLTERLFRVDPARNDGNAGIGLATVNAIVKAMGGELKIDNAAPGLRVTLRLRLEPQ